MVKHDFRVITISKRIIRIYKKSFEFCGKTSKFLSKRCLLIFCIFYLNDKVIIQQACLKEYVENQFSNSTFHKTKDKNEQKHIPNYYKSLLLALDVGPW